ncbi:hypothetical protein ACQPZF_26730 [Actinosynnema sp. CS-041913]|uniref:hypothetical protein n=1 Tax=Actinosynnema sp. CS-041913 TaxID=3239917 RepID=UPI003D90AC72
MRTIAALLAAIALISPTAARADHGPPQVGVAVYDLGDTAFTREGFRGPNELRAVVHYPKQRTTTPRPLVLQLHGMWWTCVATPKNEPTMDWPCPQGHHELPSYRGYDYLGKALARRGFVVVSIGVNGINSANPGAAYTDRAHLLNKHLEMWQRLSSTGDGELAGKFADPVTGAPVPVDFRGQVDLTNVGTMGHSRGGMAAMLHSSEQWRPTWPPGVQVRAVLPLGAVYNVVEPTEVTSVPFAVLDGGCDSIRGRSYFDDVRGRTKVPIHAFLVHGANHNFSNVQWSPGSGQAGAVDDASHEGLPAGQCTDGHAGSTPGRQLTEARQREVVVTYATAFYQRYLQGRTDRDPVLTGQSHPVRHITPVDVEFAS